ncbi:protein of unknown function [Micropruina glycogenica]|uniref:Uncharacterized protein n=1 Tax=Micropruina glycogenica TaxID=75385 RepID=A0A2N9JCU5_9ACTN|nr:protein of unknown function [Micropruina glycogenica]
MPPTSVHPGPIGPNPRQPTRRRALGHTRIWQTLLRSVFIGLATPWCTSMSTVRRSGDG